MTTFILLAAVLAVAAIAFVAWPIWKARREEAGASATGTSVVIALAIPLAAFLLYQQWSNWTWDPAARDPAALAAGQAHEMEQSIATMAARLEKDGGSVDEWVLLGRSYLSVNRPAEAVAAFAKAHELDGGRTAQVAIDYGEALALSNEGELTGRAAPLFEAGLKLDPTNAKGLWYSGLAALRSGNAALGRERWAALSATNPPAEIKAILDQRIAELDQQLGRPAQATPTASVTTSATATAASPAASATPPAATAPGTVQVRVEVAPQLAAQLAGSVPLFVLARDPSNPGPPLAAKRFVGERLPLDVTLTDADAMAPGRTVSSAKSLTIVARFSKSGMPMAQSGDLYGEARWDPAQAGPVVLTIDRTVP